MGGGQGRGYGSDAGDDDPSVIDCVSDDDDTVVIVD